MHTMVSVSEMPRLISACLRTHVLPRLFGVETVEYCAKLLTPSQ